MTRGASSTAPWVAALNDGLVVTPQMGLDHWNATRCGTDFRHLTADVSGAQFVPLIVTDGGNGDDSDHAGRAGTRITCT